MLEKRKFCDVNIDDPFFDSLKEAYTEFTDWFSRKSNEEAYVFYSNNELKGFVYLKVESGPINDISPPINATKVLKIGTFKIVAHGTRLGERFIKKVFDHALDADVKHIYVTIFEQHAHLIDVLQRYGFIHYGQKVSANGTELVYIKDFARLTGSIKKDYPVVNATTAKKWLLAVKPQWHTQLFPDSILQNEDARIINDISETNSIRKIYIGKMAGMRKARNGDCIIIYRTTDIAGKAKYRSVATSLCVVDEVRTRTSFESMDEFVQYARRSSVFTDEQLQAFWLQNKPQMCTIKMTYNFAFQKRPTRLRLIEEIGLSPKAYCGFLSLSDEQFRLILTIGRANEGLVIY